MIARVAALASLAVAIILVALVVLGNGGGYTVRADFQDAGGLVTGDQVMIGPAIVGSVQSIGLANNGLAEIKVGVSSNAAPLHQGTVARIYENSLSGIANKYVVLEPGPSSAPEIQSGGLIGEDHTYSQVSLDQVFDTLDPLTRNGLRGFIRGEAASIQGRAAQANKTLLYLAPGLSSTSNVTAELTRDEPAFDSLLIQGAQALQTLASRSQQLTQLVANTNATTAAIASQSQALQTTLSLLPPALNHSTRTFAGLNTTLNKLDPLVAASKPASVHLAQFASMLKTLTDASIPTVAALNALIHNPGGSDLTTLLKETPSLANLAHSAFPELVKEMNQSQNQVDYLRYYTPDVVAALTNLGQASAYYDANGHYSRTQPIFSMFGLSAANELTPLPPNETRYQGLRNVYGRCPGGAVQPPPDHSAPVHVPGCNPAATPPGP